MSASESIAYADDESVSTISVDCATPRTDDMENISLDCFFDAAQAEIEAKCSIVPEGSFHYHVSLGCLKAASPRFRTLKNLEPSYAFPDGKIYIIAHNMDETAFLHLLNIIHFRNILVVREIGLEQLARTAILVRYLNCAEAVQMFSDIWCDNVEVCTSVPNRVSRTLMLHICVALVFRRHGWFEDAINAASLHSDNVAIETYGLPIVKVTGMFLDETVPHYLYE
jgi:hypothetical protein